MAKKASKNDQDGGRGKLALVLTGNAARGAAHIGSLGALEEVEVLLRVLLQDFIQ